MVDTYRNILVAIDGSEKAEKAFLEAITIAKRNQATLHILYVNEVTAITLVILHLLQQAFRKNWMRLRKTR